MIAGSRRAAWALVLAACLLALGGCGGGRQKGTVTLVFKYARILGNADPLPGLLQEFEAAHPGVRVKGEALPWASAVARRRGVLVPILDLDALGDRIA